MSEIMPTFRDWFESYQHFRDALNHLYANSDGNIKNDTDFCRENKLSRAQFSKVINGGEKPSPKIMTEFEKVFPKLHAEHVKQWLKIQMSNKERLQKLITVNDLKFLIQILETLGGPLTVELALSLLDARKIPSP